MGATLVACSGHRPTLVGALWGLSSINNGDQTPAQPILPIRSTPHTERRGDEVVRGVKCQWRADLGLVWVGFLVACSIRCRLLWVGNDT